MDILGELKHAQVISGLSFLEKLLTYQDLEKAVSALIKI